MQLFLRSRPSALLPAGHLPLPLLRRCHDHLRRDLGYYSPVFLPARTPAYRASAPRARFLVLKCKLCNRLQASR
eukprot:3333590-Pleurochrysis_carterae.AAC.4